MSIFAKFNGFVFESKITPIPGEPNFYKIRFILMSRLYVSDLPKAGKGHWTVNLAF